MGWVDVAVVLMRRWFVVVPLMVIAMTLSWHVSHPQAVYWTQTNVQFMLPQSDNNPNAYVGATEALVATAGVVAIDLQANGVKSETTSADAPLIGQGVRHGYSAKLPNSGGQWAFNFDQPVIVLQVVGTSPAEVQNTLAGVMAQIDRSLSSRENAATVDPTNRIRYRANPVDPPISGQAGQVHQALLTSGLLGTAIVIALTLTLDRFLLALRARPSRRPAALGQPARLKIPALPLSRG